MQNTETYSLCSGKSPFFSGATRMMMKKIHICQLLPRCDAGEEVAAAVNAGQLLSPYQNVALNGEGYVRGMRF